MASHKCCLCGLGFASSADLQQHIFVHTSMFKCKACGKVYAHKSELAKHVLKHIEVKPFACQVCDKSYTQKQALDIHMMKHTGELPFGGWTEPNQDNMRYSCVHCNKAFQYMSQLTKHNLIHAKEQRNAKSNATVFKCQPVQDPYACSRCERTFKYKSQLDNHFPTHSRKKKHVCSFCSKRFIHKNNMVAHQKTHGSWPPICPYCRFWFKNPKVLCKHMERCSEKYRYSCELCGLHFTSQSTYQTHMLNSYQNGCMDNSQNHKKELDDQDTKLAQAGSSLLRCRPYQETKPSLDFAKCELCVYGFKETRELQEHLLKHQSMKKVSLQLLKKKLVVQNPVGQQAGFDEQLDQKPDSADRVVPLMMMANQHFQQ